MRLKAEERRKQILKCAVKVFARSNYQAARVADIAIEVGVSEAAIYRHFCRKEDIFLEILDHMSKQILAFWQEEFEKSDDVIDVPQGHGEYLL